jgi:hypothetical protein
MTIKDIILEKINAVGADGLCCFAGAIYGLGCGVDDFFPCLEIDPSECRLGKAVLIKDHCKPEDCEKCHKHCDGYGAACRTNAVIYVPMETGSKPQ